MEEYAIQSVETATENAIHQLEMEKQELQQEKELVATLQGQVVDVTLDRDELDEQYKITVRELKNLQENYKNRLFDVQTLQEENTSLLSYIQELENTLGLRNRSNPDLTIDEEKPKSLFERWQNLED